MSAEQKIKVGISTGDLNGIGSEVILKTFQDSRMLEFCTPVIFASTRAFLFQKKQLHINTPINSVDRISDIKPQKINVVNIWRDPVTTTFGKATPIGGKYAFKSLENATQALKDKKVDVLVTAPLNKHTIQSESFKFPGHTEYLSHKLQGKSLMLLISDQMKMGLVTGHIPVSQIAETITPSLLKEKIKTLHHSLKQDFRISKPRIALLGLDPHCGDKGVAGTQDDTVITPVVQQFTDEGKLVFGPYPADSFFGSDTYRNFDAILAMYHDQGLIPFKTLSFGKGVNFTAGIQRVRTSPDHGTAYEIAGKGIADHTSFREAVFSAIAIFKTRKEYAELTKNAMEKKQ